MKAIMNVLMREFEVREVADRWWINVYGSVL
jgi:hypothetical protein